MFSILLSLLILLIIQTNLVYSLYNTDTPKNWIWTHAPNNKINIQGGLIKTVHLATAYVDLTEGIIQQDDGILWSIQPMKLTIAASTNICIGIQKISELGLSPESDINSKSIGICSNGAINKLDTTETIVSQMAEDKNDFLKYKWDLIKTDSQLTITNENYLTSENNLLQKIQFSLNPSQKYFPIIHQQYSDAITKVNKCGFRCQTCNDWDEQNCLTCKNTPNIEDAPSCACKPGYTDIYDYKQNLICVQDNKVVWEPNHFEWTYLQDYRTSKYIDEKDYKSSDGSFRTYSSYYTSTYVNLDNGLEISNDYDIIRWHVSVGINSYLENNGNLCIGVQNIKYLDKPVNYSEMNGYCIHSYTYKIEAFDQDLGIYPLPAFKVQQKIGNQYRVDYEPKLGYLTITNLPFGGYEYVRLFLERQYKYFPNVIHYTGTETYWYQVIYHKCLDRCTSCPVFQPQKCLACEDSENRQEAPNCTCKPGKYDMENFTNNYYVSQTCKENLVIAELKNPDFYWKTDSTNTIIEDFDLYSNNQHGVINLYGDLGVKGMQLNNVNSFTWQFKIEKHSTNNGHVCFGVQTSEQNQDYKNSNSYNADQNIMCGLCTSLEERHSNCITTTSQSQKGEKIKKQQLSIGQTYQLTYSKGGLKISTEEFGGNLRYEFILDEYLQYVPVINFYSTLVLPDNIQIRLKTCNPKCESCVDWQHSNCLTCNDKENRQGIPDCDCKPGYEDYYDHKINKICRPKIQWNELQPPKWEWKNYGSNFKEDYQNENDGIFEIQDKLQGQVYLTDSPILQNNSKWTIRILENKNKLGFMCFGVQDTLQYKQYYSTDGNSSYQPQSVGVCTNQEYFNYYNHPPPTLKQNNMPDMSDTSQTYEFDLYYQRHLLIITNEDYGGDYRWEFPLYPERNYIPNLNKSYLYQSEGIIRFQVKACVPRCKSCVAWTPSSCISCNDAENREGVNCDCKPNFEDYYGHRKQKICRPIPVLLKPAPPQWVWQSWNDGILEDIQNNNYGVFKGKIATSIGSIMLKNRNVVEIGTQWEVNILSHRNEHSYDYICIGVIEIEQASYIGYNGERLGYSNVFCTNNLQYNYNGYQGADTKTKIRGSMPPTYEERNILSGKTFTIKYEDQYMNISDGGDIEGEFSFKPFTQHTPYIYVGYSVDFQVKGCSHRCYQCIDFSPQQCTICNDENYRQSAPSCLCKEGYYDTYNHQFNQKCIPIPKYEIKEYPEWEWYSKSNAIKELNDKKGYFDTSQRSGHSNMLVKGFPQLQNLTKWTINMKDFKESYQKFACFGIIQQQYIKSLDWNGAEYGKSINFCSDNSKYLIGSDGYDLQSYEPFVRSEFTNNCLVDFIYIQNKLIISEKDYGGKAYIEFNLNKDEIYTPIVSIYNRGSGVGETTLVQFLNCNYKCDSCVPWQPNRCNACKGQNRLEFPSCECKDGYIDYYDGIQHIDCIQQPNEVIPANWQWEIKGDQDRIIDNGDDTYYIGNGKSHYGLMYPSNIGREGIQYLEEGVKWSINIKNMTHNQDHFCFGIQNIELYNKQNFNEHAHATSIVSCTFGQQIAQASGSANGIQYISGTTTMYLQNRNLTYDLTYKQNSLEVTNIPYNGTFSTVIPLNTQIKFIPVIEIYKWQLSDYKVELSLKPCAYQCEKCNISVSKYQCTQCNEESFRSGSNCECQATYYDAGTVQCAECISPCATCKSETYCLSCISGANRASNPPFCTCLDEYFEDTEGECVQCEQQCEGCIKDADNCTACKVQTGRSLIFPKCACLDGYYEDTGTKSCQQCHESCNKCVDNTTACTECKSNQVMTPEGVCGCSIASYKLDGVCIACVSPCLMCENETTCKSCRYPTPNRLDSPQCTCKEGFYEDSSNRCLQCMEGCIECKDTANNCSKCIVDPNRSQDPFSCACNEGFIYDKISNLCKIASCPDKCSECVEGSSIQCDTCKEGDYKRLLIEDNCDCAQGYYEGGSVYCLQCNVECKSCTSLVGCTQCISTLNRGPEPYCQCDEGFFEDGSGNCEKCHYKCKVCAGTYDSCTQCIDTDINRSQSGQCPCNPGYEEDTENEICQERISCDFKCETCNPPDLQVCTKCLEGPYFRRTLSSNCDCIDGYYDNKVEPTCQKCEAPCQNCELDDQNNVKCLTCIYNDEFRNGAPNCQCPEGYTEDRDNICKEDTGCKVEFGRNQVDCSCIEGYYDDPIYLSCLKCDPQCKNCETTSSTCTECALGYQSSSFPACISCDRQCGDCATSPSDCTSCNLNRDTLPGCGCSSGYYDDMVSPDCKKCNPKCGECSDSNTCITCATNEEGRTSASKGCTCKTGYFKNSTGYCQKCSTQCLSCEKSADQCIICAFGLQRNFVAPTCGCNIGYYGESGSNNCAKCSNECITRDNKTGVYTNSAGGTYSFGVYDPSDKLNFKKNTSTITEPIEIPSSYVDDGEGNLVPESYFEKIQTAKAIQEAQELIYQQQQEAEEIQQQLEQKTEELLQQQEQLEAEQQQVEEQQQQLKQQESQAQQKEEELNTILEEITEKSIILQEKENLVVQKEVQIENIQQLITNKQQAGEDTTELEQQAQQLIQEKSLLNEEITEIEQQVQQKEAIKQIVEAEKLQLDQQVAEKQAKVQQSQEQLQTKVEEVQSIQEEIQEKQEQVETITETIKEKSQTITDLGGVVDDGEGQNNDTNGSNNGSSNSGAGGQNLSVNVNSGGISQFQCQGGCEDCDEQTPNICKRCKIGIKRLNNPPLCTCQQGYYQQGSSEDCISCPLTCSECKSFDQCTKCQPDSNRNIDEITGKCVCLSGFTEQRFGIECQRCYYYDNICYQKCPKNTVLDENTQNCLKLQTQLEDIRITILILGIIAFIIQLSIFGIFTLLAKKRNFDQLFPKVKSNNQDQSNQTLKLEEKEKNLSEDSNSDSIIQINNKNGCNTTTNCLIQESLLQQENIELNNREKQQNTEDTNAQNDLLKFKNNQDVNDLNQSQNSFETTKKMNKDVEKEDIE